VANSLTVAGTAFLTLFKPHILFLPSYFCHFLNPSIEVKKLLIISFFRIKKRPSKPVSRVLYPEIFGAVTIYLALMLPSGSSDQPGDRPGVL